jgi:hypothetical protein
MYTTVRILSYVYVNYVYDVYDEHGSIGCLQWRKFGI